MKRNRLIPTGEAVGFLQELGQEFALVYNPDFVHPEYELLPLAPKVLAPSENLLAVVMDMDGTTTTTEELCVHSLEHMVRQITGRLTNAEWQGLDHDRDYPHIIGNSTTRHVEFLVQQYASEIKTEELRRAFFHSALWTMILGRDEQRISQVKANLVHLGSSAMLEDGELQDRVRAGRFFSDEAVKITEEFIARYGAGFRPASFNERVRVAIDVYYQRYHEILELIRKGEGKHLSRDLLGDPRRTLIEPMEGIGVCLALLKGWLGEDAGRLYEFLMDESHRGTGHGRNLHRDGRERLMRLGAYCASKPLKIGVVTSSILYEAQIVMSEVFRILQEQVKNWDISAHKREMITRKFSSYDHVYDSFVTAGDSSEIRLKPHRDLYTIALHQLGIPKHQFHRVAGFEDSESGTIAIRAAGIGLCIAVPFAKTTGHDFTAASHILPGGMMEALLDHNFFIKL